MFLCWLLLDSLLWQELHPERQQRKSRGRIWGNLDLQKGDIDILVLFSALDHLKCYYFFQVIKKKKKRYAQSTVMVKSFLVIKGPPVSAVLVSKMKISSVLVPSCPLVLTERWEENHSVCNPGGQVCQVQSLETCYVLGELMLRFSRSCVTVRDAFSTLG